MDREASTIKTLRCGISAHEILGSTVGMEPSVTVRSCIGIIASTRYFSSPKIVNKQNWKWSNRAVRGARVLKLLPSVRGYSIYGQIEYDFVSKAWFYVAMSRFPVIESVATGTNVHMAHVLPSVRGYSIYGQIEYDFVSKAWFYVAMSRFPVIESVATGTNVHMAHVDGDSFDKTKKKKFLKSGRFTTETDFLHYAVNGDTHYCTSKMDSR
ncbi:hypothetical protein T265_03287 [Opisthorchis viverrini]|uniref:Uncharacterized protein n=1 Tax=Opisthorchis viverrini TaxID=6198 RepID=A0A075AHP2_OPIVI|nr:hypothetical protein T265_03287 [Opisthorchis viverrini]KER30229.1 hypothetical protein T265_03287 [Opisthorchis viverrini]